MLKWFLHEIASKAWIAPRLVLTVTVLVWGCRKSTLFRWGRFAEKVFTFASWFQTDENSCTRCCVCSRSVVDIDEICFPQKPLGKLQSLLALDLFE